MNRRLSDPEMTAPPETLAWLEEFGFKVDLTGRKKHSFDSSNSSFDNYAFDEADKTILPLGIGLRSTFDGTHTISFVQPGSPAHLAGIQKNEKLLKINGKLTNQLASYQIAKILSTDPGKLHLVVETEIS
ncbi:Oidioi.mRNA.OKI2018_I69.XSR.g14691.t1.cds [Oikopleura dioica]|uniref:Oidioi.mRNA.OKI2018_I69.XSR.g14691.t1.cds n=1 Tax=Oikopleura dioica TaxID=34765 RepID=A0ABN7SFL4_OIKDI|nr:Oidioi.mRNA.OKI2018_I69.XSR.g14691.t1.cds [Oikopleura dioica]